LLGCNIFRIFKNFVARRAQPSAAHELTQKNIYIFPSGQGAVFLTMLLLMLVTAINYQSSLIYLFVFILFAVFSLSIWLCFFNLQGVRLRADNCAPLEAGKPLHLTISLFDSGKDRWGIRAILDEDGADALRKNRSAEFVWFPNPTPDKAYDARIQLVGRTYARGVYALPGIKFETFFPFGLVRAWTWLWFDAPVVVYPSPLSPPVDQAMHASEQAKEKRTKGSDPDDSRRFHEGDSLRRVMWRHYALRDELRVQDSEWQGSNNTALRWETYSGFGLELALSYLCFDVFELANENATFSLSMPNGEVALGVGTQHLEQCLLLLASCKQ
jgi:uncharacterized protein (DUF58 family)